MNKISAALKNDIFVSVLLICIFNSTLSEKLHPQISRTEYTHQYVNEAITNTGIYIHHNKLTLYGFMHFLSKVTNSNERQTVKTFIQFFILNHSVKILWTH